MSPSDQWKEISALYAAALERPDTERAAFLHEACGSDEDLYARSHRSSTVTPTPSSC